MMKKLVTGIVAHVDSGKTTLSESLLYISGTIRKLGRVDHKDAFLDTYELERARGITIFSKQAEFSYGDTEFTLLDTPGHVDFSAEMERTLQVLDYAILVVSGADGVQGHTKTLWRLLEQYEIPTFVFVNKMDQPGIEKEKVLSELRQNLSGECIDFDEAANGLEGCSEEFFEAVAMSEEELLDQFLEEGQISCSEIRRLICERKVFPCFFGSALKLTGVEEFLAGLNLYTSKPIYSNEFGAKVYKISRDEQGNRLTHLKITGGTLKVKSVLSDEQEKVNQIRIYHGAKYDTAAEVGAGTICAVTGLTKTKAGEGLGIEAMSGAPILIPVLNYEVILPVGYDAALALPKFMMLEEEIPELHILWDEVLKTIQIQVMGEVQTEVLKSVVKERFGIDIALGSGNIVYKETIAEPVEGVGHFEPLRHYAEVHLLIEPGERGSGLQFETNCSEDILDRNWQRLILTHLLEKEYKGVLTGSYITDLKITLVAGRAHIKHTEGGDFREATYRAVRQGLKKAHSILLEPYYQFNLEIPDQALGRAMMDLEKMNAQFQIKQSGHGIAILQGKAPVALIQHYQSEVIAYTKGHGTISLDFAGYDVCHNAEEVIQSIGYDSEHDLANPTGSVFCAHGAGFLVPWDEVERFMHVENVFRTTKHETTMEQVGKLNTQREEEWIDTDEIDAILERTFYSNRKGKSEVVKARSRKRWADSYAPVTRRYQSSTAQEEYLLVDGYNIIFANQTMHELALENMDAANQKLMDILCNYQGIRGCKVLLVFDAYRVVGHQTEMIPYHNIQVVYTKEAETADQFIEKFAHQNAQKFRITVATSDSVEQIIIRSKGCALLSARDFWMEIERAKDQNREHIASVQQSNSKNYLFDSISESTAIKLEEIRKGKVQE